MNFPDYTHAIKKTLSIKEKRYAAVITVVIALIIVTPLCGFVFQCGCDWPWLGLESGCNYYQANSKYRCPWCSSMIAGIFSIGTAIIFAVWSSIVILCPVYLHANIEVLVRTFIGVTVFVVIAILAAALAAMWQEYPLGIGNYFILPLSNGSRE